MTDTISLPTSSSTQEPQPTETTTSPPRFALPCESETSPTSAEESAWQILKPFINPIDCNFAWSFQDLNGKLMTGIRPLNLNTTMNALINGEMVELAYFTKKKFLQHCRGQAKYYYRSRWNGFACTGYGGHDKAWKKLNCNAQRYALDTKKITSSNIAVVLLGFDVDAHHGEHDVQQTTNLILNLFPGAYHEPSTNGLGRHVYVKIYYDIHSRIGGHYAVLHHLQNLCTIVANGIEQKRIRAGYDAELDRIRGLPTMIGMDKVDGKSILINRTLSNGTIIQKPKLKVTCRNLVIKIPFYRNCTHASVDQFFQSPFYSLQHLEDLQEQMYAAGIGMPEFVFRDDIQDGINELLSGSIDIPEKTQESPQTTENNNLPNNIHNSVFPAAQKYHTAAQNLLAVQNSHERRVEHGLLYCRYLGRVPTGQELEQEYRSRGLWRAESKSDQSAFRFDQISNWLEQRFNPTKCRFGYGGYKTEKDKTEALMAKQVAGLKLVWNKGSGNRRIQLSKLAALYWCMRHSQGRNGSTYFSYKQAKTALLETLTEKAHSAEIAAMYRVLVGCGLLKKASNYCPGHCGWGWIVGELS